MITTTRRPFGISEDGRTIYAYTMTNRHGSSVTVINYGAAITSIVIQTAKGPVDVALGYRTLKEYEANDGYLGACIGRVANRIGGAHFQLNGASYQLAANDGANHLHGGTRGFDKHYFQISPDEKDPGCLHAVRISENGEEHYPGTLKVQVDYTWDDEHCLCITYRGQSDADTPVNLTNHTYFNLSGENSKTILDHELTIHARYFTENDAHCLPTGRILPVERTPFDFRQTKAIGRDINDDHPQLRFGRGYDHNFIIEGSGMRPIARAYAPKTGIGMTVHSDMPGVQFYSGNSLTGQTGKSGIPYNPRSGFCLETQYYPNALACPDFPSIILKKGQHYCHQTIYAFDSGQTE